MHVAALLLVCAALLVLQPCVHAKQHSDHNCTTLFTDDFSSPSFDPSNASSPYAYFFTDPATANIKFSTCSHGRDDGLVTTIDPFNQTNSQTSLDGGVVDHLKAFILLKAPFDAAAAGGTAAPVLRYSLEAGAHCSPDAASSPFPPRLISHAQDDLRLSTCGMSAVDFVNGMVTDFLITNSGVYAYYERLPFFRSPGDNYASFAQVKHVGSRKVDDINAMSIEYNSEAGTFSWFLKSKLVLLVDQIGFQSRDPKIVTMYDLGGNETLVPTFTPNIGFGCFTLLDAIDYWKPRSTQGLVQLDPNATSYTLPSSFYDPDSLPTSRLWGQGAKLSLRKLQVQLRSK